jgi:hypothetical protein
MQRRLWFGAVGLVALMTWAGAWGWWVLHDPGASLEALIGVIVLPLFPLFVMPNTSPRLLAAGPEGLLVLGRHLNWLAGSSLFIPWGAVCSFGKTAWQRSRRHVLGYHPSWSSHMIEDLVITEQVANAIRAYAPAHLQEAPPGERGAGSNRGRPVQT